MTQDQFSQVAKEIGITPDELHRWQAFCAEHRPDVSIESAIKESIANFRSKYPDDSNLEPAYLRASQLLRSSSNNPHQT